MREWLREYGVVALIVVMVVLVVGWTCWLAGQYDGYSLFRQLEDPVYKEGFMIGLFSGLALGAFLAK